MFVIDVMSRVPVYEQIINQFEEQIMTGILKEGDKMPSVRSLSFISHDDTDAFAVNVREKLPKLNQIVRELALAGISKDEIIENVNKVYEEIE